MKTLKEVDGDLINHWYILCLESEIPQNKTIRRTLYDVPYVIFRNQEGGLSIFEDRCIHRYAKLSEGTLNRGVLSCPYHGWKYNSQGEVIEIPSEGRNENTNSNKIRNKLCAKSPPSVLQDGCLWIWPGDILKKTPQPSWRFPFYGNQNVAQYFMITDFKNEVTQLAENFMDVPHTVFVHSKWFRRQALIKVPMIVSVKEGRVLVTYDQPDDVIGFTKKILNPKGKPTIHTDEFIFPNITRVDYKFGDNFFVINSQATPISRYQTRVYTWIAYNIGFLSKLMKPILSFYTRKVIQQDVEIMANQGPNLEIFEQLGEIEFKSTQADELHLAIDRFRNMGVKDRNSVYSMNYERQREFWI